ncbi:glycosyltransferase [Thermosipho ferrireducens]|uniref:Glycosyltransferase n=1 Tax=Thermosipho ferrireducens TaxID=2571116 RepID=A0ABX7S7J1_9BACT|nr:glycosyltransferase [Thermosipho ferrireducens]QTA38562.1 glycosyltransferase [Thermosipho ferrireducens]
MKVLYITNLSPIIENFVRGIFVHKRLKIISNIISNFDVIMTPIYCDSKLLKTLRKILKKEFLSCNEEFAYEGITYKYVNITRSLVNAIMQKILKNYYKKHIYIASLKILGNLVDTNYDLIHAHGMYNVPAGIIAQKISENLKVPYLITAHGSDVNILMIKRKKDYISVMENASKVIFVSNALLEKAKSYGYSGKNAVVIPNGYDPNMFYPMDKEKIRRELGIYKDGCKYVGFVGNLTKIKRADKFPNIFHNISKEIGNAMFILVGDGKLRNRLEKQTKDLDIIFTGKVPQKEVSKWMNAMDVMILPSRNEGFGAVVIEAQACGTAVVGSNNGGIPEAIGFEKYVVKEGDNFEKRFANKVVEVLRNGYNKGDIIKRAKEFTWKKIVEKEVEVYEEVVGGIE